MLLGPEFILKAACERFVSGYFSTAQVTCCRITGWLWTTASKRMLFNVIRKQKYTWNVIYLSITHSSFFKAVNMFDNHDELQHSGCNLWWKFSFQEHYSRNMSGVALILFLRLCQNLWFPLLLSRKLLFTIHSFIHSFSILSPPLKRFLHTVRSRASSFKWEYPLLSLRSSSSFLRLLLVFLSLSSLFIFPSITCFRRQFLRKMWPI